MRSFEDIKLYALCDLRFTEIGLLENTYKYSTAFLYLKNTTMNLGNYVTV